MKIDELIHKGMKVDVTERESAVLSLSLSHSVNTNAAKTAIAHLLNSFGIDRTDPNFKETPRRVANLYAEWLKPRSLSLKAFPSPTEGLVTLRHHTTISVCPHHLLPFEIVCDMSYIPLSHAIGLSKLARLVDFCAGSFLLQENITELIGEVLNSLLLPRGVAVKIAGSHACMRLRGIKSDGTIITTALRGAYLTDEKCRAEFWEATK